MTENTDLDMLEDISRTSIRLLLREPFYAHILACLNKRIVGPDDPVKSLALGLIRNSYELSVHPAFWSGLPAAPDWRYGLLKHEILHLVFKHPLVDEPGMDRPLTDLAMDLAVNQYVRPADLPPGSVWLEHFPELQLPPGQSWRYYYRRLEELQADRRGRYAGSRAAAELDRWKTESEARRRHEPWASVRELSPLERSILESALDHLMKLAYEKTPPRSITELPGSLRIYLDQLFALDRPLVDWRRVVKIFAASSAKTRIKNTIQRASKRYGTVPGIKVKRLRKLLVAVDTSGSIAREELELFFHEIRHIWRQGAEIRIVECDADIREGYEYRGQTPAFVTGGGDTNFDAPIRYGNERFLPDGLIYFTDGHAPAPKINARFPILWVVSPQGLTPDNAAFQALPGRKARLVVE